MKSPGDCDVTVAMEVLKSQETSQITSDVVEFVMIRYTDLKSRDSFRPRLVWPV